MKAGDEVEVLDEGLAMLRRIVLDAPPNHHGRVQKIEGDMVYVEFPIGGRYKRSQVAPYPRAEVRLRRVER